MDDSRKTQLSLALSAVGAVSSAASILSWLGIGPEAARGALFYTLPIITFAGGFAFGFGIRSYRHHRNAGRKREVTLRELRRDYLSLNVDERCLVYACAFDGEQDVTNGSGIRPEAVRRFVDARTLGDVTIYMVAQDATEMFERYPDLREAVEKDLQRIVR